MILLIDNYDSFSYNLFQLVGQINPDIKVSRNDKITVEEINDLNPECIILSPGSYVPCISGLSGLQGIQRSLPRYFDLSQKIGAQEP